MATGVISDIGKLFGLGQQAPPPGSQTAEQFNKVLAPVSSNPVHDIGNILKGIPGDIARLPGEISHPEVPDNPIWNFLFGSPSQSTTGTDIGPHTPVTPSPPGPEPLTYQQIVSNIVKPMMSSLGQLGNTQGINAVLAPNSAGVPQSIEQNIASTIHNSVNDYSGALQLMLKTEPTQTTQQALLKGLQEVIAYPVSGLTGSQGAPPGVAQAPFLNTLYQVLNQERSGGLPLTTSTTSPSSGYNSSINSLLAG